MQPPPPQKKKKEKEKKETFLDSVICLSVITFCILVIIKVSWLWSQVFDCPIREDSASVLSELKNSSHDLVSGTFSVILVGICMYATFNILDRLLIN